MKNIKASLLLLPLLLFASPAFSAELIHNPVLAAAASQNVDISAVLSGANSGAVVRLFYRVKGKELYKSLQMGGNGGQVSGQIPGSDVVMPGVEYYIEATINGQVIASTPTGNYKLTPNFITVRKDETKPDMAILAPMEGDEVDTSQPVITASYSDADSGIDTSSVLVKIDGTVVKDKAQVQAFDTLMSYVPSDELTQGKHEVVVLIKDNAGNIGSLKWSFTVKSKFSSKAPNAVDASQYHWDGYFNYESMYGYVAQQPASQSTYLPFRPYGVNRGRLEVNGRGADDTYQLKVYKTDEERTDQQPSDRYLALMKSDEGIIALGDYSPSFSELSLYNPYFFRGVTVDLRDGALNEAHSRLMGIFGETQRGVNAGVSAFSGVPGAAQFEEYMYGTRWELGGKYYGFGLNAVTVNDDAGSIDNTGSLQPKYTGLGTADLQLKIPQIYLVMSGETGADYYFNGPGITGVSAGSAFKAGADLNVVPWSTHGSFEWRDLGGGFGLVPGGFATMANPGLIPDYRGFESSLSQGILNGQLSLSGNFNSWHDNLNGAKDISTGTTQTDFWSVFGTAAFTGLPYLNAGVTQNIQKNDVDSISNTLQAETNFVSTSFNISLGYNYIIDPTSSLTGNFSLVDTTFRDMAAVHVAQDLDSDSYTVSLFYVKGASSFSAAGSMGTNNQPGVSGSTSFGGITTAAQSGSSDTISVAWIQRWVPKVFDSHLNYDFAKNHSESPEVDTVVPPVAATDIDSTRSTYALGFDYTLKTVNTFGLTISYAMVDSNSNDLGVVLNDHVGELLGDFTYNYTF